MYTKDVLSHLTPYMKDLVPLFVNLKNALKEDTDISVSHANFKRIFVETRDILPDVDVIPRGQKISRNAGAVTESIGTLSENVQSEPRRKVLASADATYTLERCRQSEEIDEGAEDNDAHRIVWEEGEFEDIGNLDADNIDKKDEECELSGIDDMSVDETEWEDFEVKAARTSSSDNNAISDAASSTLALSSKSRSTSDGNAFSALRLKMDGMHLSPDIARAQSNASAVVISFDDAASTPSSSSERRAQCLPSNNSASSSSISEIIVQQMPRESTTPVKAKRSRKKADSKSELPHFDFTLTRAKARLLGLSNPEQ